MSVKHILYTALLQVKTPVWVSHECAGPNEFLFTLYLCVLGKWVTYPISKKPSEEAFEVD